MGTSQKGIPCVCLIECPLYRDLKLDSTLACNNLFQGQLSVSYRAVRLIPCPIKRFQSDIILFKIVQI